VTLPVVGPVCVVASEIVNPSDAPGASTVVKGSVTVNPVVAVALGTLFLAEPLSPRTVVAAGIILVAVAIIVTARGDLGSGPADERGDGRRAAAPPPGGHSEAAA